MMDMRMPDINNVLIAGNLTKDPVLRKTGNGTSVTNFWIACNRRFKDNLGQWRENVCFVGVVTWYKLAENCARNLQKGSAVLVEGELQSRSLKSSDGRGRSIVEIKARRVQFLNRRDSSSAEDDFERSGEDETYQEAYSGGQDDDFCCEEEDGGSRLAGPQDDSGAGAADTAAGFGDTAAGARKNPQRGRFDFGFQELNL